MKYSVHCFNVDINKKGTKGVLDIDVKSFWQNAKDLINGCGVYIFARKHGDSYTPFYVGQTNKANFGKEVFNCRNTQIYQDCSREYKGRFVMLLVALRTNKGGLSSATVSTKREIDWLEKLFIEHALCQNNKLCNTAHTAFYQTVCVPGILNSGKGTTNSEACSILKNALKGIPIKKKITN